MIIEQEEPFVPSKDWAEMIRKVYEVDPLICPSCGGKMLVTAFIKDPKIIDKIIKHLKLSFHAEWSPPPQVIQHELLMAAEEREEYFLGDHSLLSIDLEGKESIFFLIVLQFMSICPSCLFFNISF